MHGAGEVDCHAGWPRRVHTPFLFSRAPPEIVNTVVKITDASQPIRENLTKVLRINTHLCLSVQYLQVAPDFVGIPLFAGLSGAGRLVVGRLVTG
jgi:hypothetical protein